jgi:hypothetical protein
MKPDYIIAIDPDVKKSGVACLRPSTRQMEATSLPFPLLLDYLQHEQKARAENRETLTVVVEAGWFNKSNWHLEKDDTIKVASAKGNSNGRNHETGKKIVEMCLHYGINVIEQRPLRKCWKGKDGKITPEELAYFTGLLTRKTEQEARDAALLAWHHAGLPIKIKTGNR